MTNAILIIGLIFALIELLGEHLDNRIIIYVSKPLVMVCIVVWMTVQIDFEILIGNDVMFPLIWFLIGMVFCLFGDIFLMGEERFFIPGLVSFLIGQILFITGFNQILPKEDYILPGVIVLIFVVLVSVKIFSGISKGIDSKDKTRMKIPVAIYSFVISVMLYAALLTLMEREWNYQAALLVAFGALFFYISDILNAWIRFVKPIKYARVKVMVTYYLAQFSISAGAVLHYLYRPDS